MKEISEDESKLDSNAHDKIYFTQYIQDLYRFFNLHPDKTHFFNVFNIELDVTESHVLELVTTEKNIRKIGEFYFQKNYFHEAGKTLSSLLANKNEYEIIEKVGFCYQKAGDYHNAIEYYKQAEILETNRTWLHKKLGYCYRAIAEFDKAIEYYGKVEQIEPDNLEVQVLLGQLHIDKEDYETALKYYFKIEYLKPDLVKVQRPLAWCSFLLGKLDQAIRYLQKVISAEGQRSDYLNLGHCYWADGKVQDAIENYREAIKRSGNNYEWFSKALNTDIIYLKSYEIENLDISLMSDYLNMDIH